MDSLDLNKGCAAVLVAGIAFMGASLIGDALVKPERLAKAAYQIELPDAAKPKATEAVIPEPPVALLLASADPARGEAGVKSQGCVACHSLNEGGKAGVGPNLYGVVGAPHGHMEGYAYSAALKAKTGGWTYDNLNDWLRKPSAYAPGTKMTYAGLADPKKRADIIDYLRTLAAKPEPLPEPPAQNAAVLVPASASAQTGIAQTDGVPEPIEARLVQANAQVGQADTLKQGCIACHSFNQGGKAGVGPNLYGVVGAPHGHMEGYTYSASLKAKAGPWTYAELDKWLAKPAAYAPGTKMTFAGIANPKDRADVIAYLRTLAATPKPLPATP